MEYKGVIPPDQLQNKQHELEREANSLISRGGKVSLENAILLLLTFTRYFVSMSR